MRRRKSTKAISVLLSLALVFTCASAFGQTAFAETTALTPFGTAAGGTVSTGRYVVNSTRSLVASNGPGLTVSGTVLLYIPAGVTLSVTGAAGSAAGAGGNSANATCTGKKEGTHSPGGTGGAGGGGGYAGIRVPSGSTLIITGEGTLIANGGKGGNAGAGGNGGSAACKSDMGWRSAWSGGGGGGGGGAGGGGAGIGGNGGSGGKGGTGGGGLDNKYGYNNVGFHDADGDTTGNSGSAGGNGSSGLTCGAVYKLGSVSVTATAGVGGSASTVRGGAGSRDNTGRDTPRLCTSGGAGGGAGGAGKAGANIGSGGGGGGAGGGGGGGGYWYSSGSEYGWRYANPGGGGASGGLAGNAASGSDDKGNWSTGGSGGSQGANASSTAYSSGTPEYAKITVALDQQGGSGGASSVTAVIGLAMPTVTMPTRYGYTFHGYYTGTEGGTKYYEPDGSSARLMDFESGELHAVWTVNTNLISANFWRINGTFSTAETLSGYLYPEETTLTVTATQPPLTVNYDGRVMNWLGFTTEDTANANTSYSTDLTRAISGGENFNSLYSGNVTLTFSANGGSSAPPSQTAKQYLNANVNGITGTGNTFTISNSVPVRTGFNFLGWARSSTATQAEYEPGNDITGVLSNTTLYAVWAPIVYYVKYNPNGGSGVMAQTTHYYGIASQLSPNRFSLSYTVTYKLNDGRPDSSDTAVAEFDGWASNSYGAVTYVDEQSVTNLAKSDGVTVNLFAHWLKGSVTLPNATRYGYNFSGWYTDAACTDLAGMGGESFTPSRNTSLYAKWDPKSYTVTYNGNGETGGATTSSRHVYDVASPLSPNGFIKNYTVSFVYNGATSGNTQATLTAASIFSGWALTADGPAVYTDNENVMNLAESGVVQLFATWRDGSVVLPIPEKTNKVFDGWYYDADLTRKAGDGGTDYTSASNVTLYAKWKDVEDPILVKAPGSSTVIEEETGFIYGLPDRDVGSASDIVASNFANITGGAGYVTYEYSNNEGVVGTGTKVFLYRADGVLMKTYTIIIFGDNDGDGYITMADATDATYFDALLDSTYDYEDMSIANVKAMDLNADGMVDQRDISIVIYYAALLIDEVDQTGAGTLV